MIKLQAVNFGVSIPFFFVTSGICALADVFKDCQHFYTEVGFPEEWRLHYQEGMIGYASREINSDPEDASRNKVRSGFCLEPLH